MDELELPVTHLKEIVYREEEEEIVNREDEEIVNREDEEIVNTDRLGRKRRPAESEGSQAP